MSTNSPQRINWYGAVTRSVVKDQRCTRWFWLGMLLRTADARGEVSRIERGVRANFDEGAGQGLESAIAMGGLWDVKRVPRWSRREGELEIGYRGVVGLGFGSVESGVG